MCKVSGGLRTGRTTHHAPRTTFHASRITHHAFTLIEMLMVISIMGIIAAIALPAFHSLRPNPAAAGSAQLLTDVARARQLAISHRTTVFMVFVPMLSTDPIIQSLAPAELAKVKPLLDKQLTSYAYFSARSIGDQPGRPTTRYLSSWKSLPEGAFIPPWKFAPPATYINIPNPATGQVFPVYGFKTTTIIPFPTVENPIATSKLALPYIAFDYLGRLVDDSGNLLQQPPQSIPVAKGGLLYPRDAQSAVTLGTPGVSENPMGNSSNSFNLVSIDWLTGRGHIDHQEVR